MTVCSTLHKNDLRIESSDQVRDHGLECAEIGLVPRAWRKWHVDFEPCPFTCTRLVGKTCAWEEVSSALVEVDVKNARVIIETVHDSISMMSVDVEVNESLDSVIGFQMCYRDRGIVEDAESGSTLGVCVVEP